MTFPIVNVEDVAAPVKGAIASGPFGSAIGRKFFVAEGVPVIRGNNLTLGKQRFVDNGFVFITEEKASKHRNCLVFPDDIIFTAVGSLGQVGIIPRDGQFSKYFISNKQLKLTPDTTRFDPLFLYYWFSSSTVRHHFVSSNRGAAVPLITLGVLRGTPVPFPPLPIQKRIAAILSAYDDLIEVNTRRIAILEEMARRIYEEWFVRFRFPGGNGARPKDWSNGVLGDIASLKYGKALKADDRQGGQVAVYGSGGIVGWHNQHLVEGPGIIVGRKGNVGSVFWSPIAFFPIDTAYYVETSRPMEYVHQHLKTFTFESSDAAVPGLNRDYALTRESLIPPDNIIAEFAKAVRPMYRLQDTLRQQNTNLRAQRDLLLPRLVSGRLDVSEVDVPNAKEPAHA